MFVPNFEVPCRICETLPTVVIPGHLVEETELCGTCFFGESSMKDWMDWNEQKESTE